MVHSLDSLRTYNKFFASVNTDVYPPVNDETNLRLITLNVGGNVYNYKVAASSDGITDPSTHMVASGVVRKSETIQLLDFYNIVDLISIDSWLLSVNNEILWKRNGGWQTEGQYGDFNGFLSYLTPPLQLNNISEGQSQNILYAIVDKNKKGQVNSKLRQALGQPGRDYLKAKLSPTGEMPHTHFGFLLYINSEDVPSVKAQFPVDPLNGKEIWILDSLSHLLWTDDGGDIPTQPLVNFNSFAMDKGLKLIKDWS